MSEAPPTTLLPTPTGTKYVVFKSRRFGHMFFSLSGGEYAPEVHEVVGGFDTAWECQEKIGIPVEHRTPKEDG